MKFYFLNKFFLPKQKILFLLAKIMKTMMTMIMMMNIKYKNKIIKLY